MENGLILFEGNEGKFYCSKRAETKEEKEQAYIKYLGDNDIFD